MPIEFKNVSKTLGNNQVVNDVSFAINEGQITGLKGINGAGKTMLMRLIAGLIYPTSGQVLVDGQVIGKDVGFPPSIGIMLENPAFLNAYTGFENLKMLAIIKGLVSDEQIRKVLQTIGLGEGSNKKYRKYSLGMKQRLGIAAAIMESPQIILLDEPTNSLDADGVELVKSIILAEKARGATVVLSCHDTALLEAISDEIFTVEVGKIVDHYSPKKEATQE